MHIRTYVNCFGNIILQMFSVHCRVSKETSDKAIFALRKYCIMPFLKKHKHFPVVRCTQTTILLSTGCLRNN